MVNSKPVLSLRCLAIRVLPRMVCDHITKTARQSFALSWYNIFQGNLEPSSPRDALYIQVELFKRWIEDQVVWTDREEMFLSVLKGIEKGIHKIRGRWKTSTDHKQHAAMVEAVSTFTEVVAWEKLRVLNFAEVPRAVRSRIMEMLPRFGCLHTLVIGPGNEGGWIPIRGKHAIDLCSSLSHLTHLSKFSMKRDCSEAILEVVVVGNQHSLQVLDVEYSKSLTDSAVGSILQCYALVELNMFSTGFSHEGQARIIMGLPRLRHLIRSDFLCDALGWIDYLEEMEEPVFDIRDFMPSQSYFFHESWQMEMVARMCPRIEKMLFIQHQDTCPSLMVLADFRFLQQLELHGAIWPLGDAASLLRVVGGQLTRLGLISVKGMDVMALCDILETCGNLTSLAFNNCEFGRFSEPSSGGRALPLASLEEVVISSAMSEPYVRWLLVMAARVRVVHLGALTHVTDQTFQDLAPTLTHLEELQVEKSPDLSLSTLHLLLSCCPSLRSLGDLACWGGVGGAEMGEVRSLVHHQNMALDLSSNQVLRRFLELGGTERKTLMNMMTGPAMERIRMARERERQQMAIQNH